MLTKIILRNYRAFRFLSINIPKLTVLVGPNNSGKSAFTSFLNLLSQTTQSLNSEVPLLLNGSNEDLGTYKDIVYKNDIRSKISARIEWLSNIKQEEKSAIDLGYKYRTQRREIILDSFKFENLIGQKVIQGNYTKDSEKLTINYFGKELKPSERSEFMNSFRFMHFLPQFIGFRQHVFRKKIKEIMSEDVFFDSQFIVNRLHDYLSDIEFIGPIRTEPKRSYLFSGEAYKSIGRTGDKAPDIFANDTLKRGKRKIGLRENVSRWLKKLDVASDINIFQLSDRHYEIKVRHPKTNEFENLADVGYGICQILPILVAGFNVEPKLSKKGMLIVQQPEIHLHPRAQAELGDFFVEILNNYEQCIIETHSEHLLLRIQSNIAAGNLSPNDVAVYYFYPKTENQKEAKRLNLNDQGHFIDEWPGGFFPERLSEARKLANAAFKKLKEKEGK